MPSSATDALDARIDAAIPPALERMIRTPVEACLPGTPVRTALEAMRRRAIGSMVVVDDARRPIGILTLRDVLDRIALEDLLAAPIAQVMTRDPVCLGLADTAYDAAIMMVRRGVRHVVVIDGGGLLAGIVSERDLFGMQTTGVRHLSGALKSAADLPAVEAFGREIQALACRMLRQGTAIAPLTAFISSLIDLLTERIVQLELEAARVNIEACWIVMGSEGRSEQTLLTDQDNGIIFQTPAGESPDDVRALLVPIAQRINQALDRAGYRLCSGNIMGGNPQWCLAADEWRSRFAGWIDSGSPEALLRGSIFFDLRPLTGATQLAHGLRAWLVEHAAKNRRFLHQMAANALRNRPALNLLQRFARGEDGAVDLKLQGVGPFVDSARIMSLAAAFDAVHTESRLRGAGERIGIPGGETDAWVAAFYQIQGCRLHSQARQIAAGQPVSNRLDPETLNGFDREVLRLALIEGRSLQRRLALDHGV
jgi:CBS domain-containing protein